MKRLCDSRDNEFLACRSCNRRTTNRCTHCQTAPYCNDRCCQMQRNLHKIVCFTLLGDRLRAMVSYSRVNDVELQNLSSFEIVRDRPVSAFSRHGYGDLHCAVCEVGIVHQVSKKVYIFFQHRLLYYHLCPTCTGMKRRLCEASLMEIDVCKEVHKNRKSFFIFLNRALLWGLDTPYDIIRYILFWVVRVNRVSNCCH
jgi:hypothetical protein